MGYERRNRRLARAFHRHIAPSISMPFCLIQRRNLLVSDPCDKICAMMNLPHIDSEACTFARPNYINTAIEVFKAIAAKHVRQTQSLEVLDFFSHTAKVLRTKKYSWGFAMAIGAGGQGIFILLFHSISAVAVPREEHHEAKSDGRRYHSASPRCRIRYCNIRVGNFGLIWEGRAA